MNNDDTQKQNEAGSISDTTRKGVQAGMGSFREDKQATTETDKQSSHSFRKNTRGKWIIGIVLGLIIVLVLIGSIEDNTHSDNPGKATITSSKEAREVSRLLNDGKYNAADVLLTKYITDKPNDAELYCQYVRMIVEGYDITSDPWISNPIITDDKYRALSVAQQACKIASELDEGCKAKLARIILNGIYDQMKAKLDADNGFVPLYNSSAIYILVFTAIELDSDECRSWAEDYKSLIPGFLKIGKGLSVMMLGNIAGDFESGAQGDADFWGATDAFRQVVESGNYSSSDTGDATSLYEIANVYMSLFEQETSAAVETKESHYTALLDALNDADSDIQALGLPEPPSKSDTSDITDNETQNTTTDTDETIENTSEDNP